MSVLKEKVRKIIKKATRFVLWTTGIIAVLLVALYFTIRTPAAQTWITQRLAAYMSEELDTRITIGGVDIRFFTSIELEEIYVEDQHGDTLLHAPSFTVDISNFNYKKQHVSIDEVVLTDATIKIKKYPNERGLNFRFFVLYFDSGDTTAPPPDASPWDVDLGEIRLENCRFAYIDTRWTDVDRGMDYENIQARNIFATLERIEPMGDSTSIFLSELKAREQSGFTVDHMESRLMLADTFVKFNDLIIQTPGSDVKGFLSFHFASFDDVEDDFIHKVKMQGHFSESVVEMGDIAYFSPVLLGIQKKVMLTGDFSGTVEKLKTRNIDLRFGKRSRIAGNFSFDGLPDIENTDMHFRFKDATTNYEDLSGIPIAPFNDSSFLEVPSRIAVLGDMFFTGTVEGFTHDFVAHGKLRTAQGNLVLENLAMSKDSTDEDYNWNGVLTAQEFNIGNYLDVEEMGAVSGTASLTGYGTRIQTMRADIDGSFTAFEFNGYRYTNIEVKDATLAKEVFDGNIVMNDPNVKLNYKGSVDFKNPDDPKLRFKAHIEDAYLSKLGFVDTSWHMVLTTDMFFEMNGSNIDNLNGIMRFWDVKFTKEEKEYNIDALALSSYPNANGRTLQFDSDFMTATLSGQYEIMKLPEAVTDVMSAYLPAYFPPRKIDPRKAKSEKPQHFNWTASFGRNTEVITAFLPGIKVAPGTYSFGSFNQQQRNFDLFFHSDSIGIGSYEVEQTYVTAQGTGGKATLDVKVVRAQVNDTTGFDNVAVTSTASDNVLNSTLDWNNNTTKANRGTITSEVVFENGKSLQMKVQEGKVTFNDTTWTVDPTNLVRRDSSVLTFNNLMFRSGGQAIGVDGKISRNPTDHLDVRLDRFNLSAINYVSQASGITVSGYISGTVVLSDLYKSPTFSGDANIYQLYLNKEKLGDGTAQATWFNDKQGVYIKTSFSNGIMDPETNKPIENINLTGWYYPKREGDNLDMELKLHKMPLGLLQPVLADFVSRMYGDAGGVVSIKGSFDKPLLEGALDLSIRGITVDYLGITLEHRAVQEGKFHIEPNSFYFDNFKLTDTQRDTAVVDGHLYHDNFKNFQFDMYIAFEHFMVLNTTQRDNEDFFGRVYATGFMDIFGYADKKISMDITATTTGVMRNGNYILSDFNIPMSTANEAGTGEFVTFFDASDTIPDDTALTQIFHDNGLDLTLNLTATPDARVNIIFDETVGDELTARGSGDLQINIKPNGEFSMVGSYYVKQGDYMFTLKNIVYAPFELVEGGVISWNGDPADARIDADAIYRANASVEPFFPFDSTTAAYQQNYPVNVIMHLDGQLANPGLTFDIELPTADPNIQETVRSYTQTDLEMNRQVLSLMVLNSFMTPSEFRDGGEDGSGVGGAGTTLLSNFVSGTLNNWLSQISDNANVKFKYRPNDDMSLQELKLALGTQLLNNRLTFDVAGSVTNASQTQTQSTYNLVGDVSAEYKLTEDGKVRLRAFNRGAENATTDVTDGTQYTQGAGIFYREDFETFGELLRRYKEKITAPNPNRVKNVQQQQQQINPTDTLKPKTDTVPLIIN